jgi:transposase, IS30 family
MRTYRQLTPGERYALSALRKQGFSQAEIARSLGRHRSTISREVRRNSLDGTGRIYRPSIADDYARWRRSRSRRNRRFKADDWALVLSCLKQQWSPEQISGTLKRDGRLYISHESIYRHIWHDKRHGGTHYKLLRQAGKKRRKRYGAYDSRGRLAGKRHISERPSAVEDRYQFGHWEIDTVLGAGRPCVVTLVERTIGYVLIGKLRARSVAELNRATIHLISSAPLPVHTITADNGTEFHGYSDIEAATGTRFYFANPHHSWERGTSENTNGLLRQYLPKRKSMARLSQAHCDRIAAKLNDRPRRRLGFRTPRECYDIYSAT